MSKAREFLKTLTKELDARGVRYWVEKSSKHGKLHLDLPIGKRFHVFPCTPSDHRGVKNSLAQLRRMIRESNAEAAACLGSTAGMTPAAA